MAHRLATEDDRGYVRGFAVVVERVVGEVDLDGRGEHTPIEAAMLIIGGVAEEGRYKFPGPDDGQTVVVEVTFVGEPGGTP